MGLTDLGLIVVLACAAVALWVLVVLGWPVLRHRTPRLVVRTVQVLFLNALCVTLALAILNDQYVFYSSWSDLFGTTSVPTETHRGASSTEALAAPARGSGPRWDLPAPTNFELPQPGKRLQTYSVLDPSTDVRVPVLVYLPVGYDPGSARRYPVILGLHGFPASPVSFARLNFLSTADRLTAKHELAASIFVIPQINVPTLLDTECVNGPPGDPQTDTWLTSVVPAWAARHLHVQLNRTSWATLGYSYGGWCSAVLAMRHPNVFGAAVVFEGYFRPRFEAAYDPLTRAQERAYDLVRLAHSAPPPIAMWVFAARQDQRYYPATATFLAAVRPPLSVTELVAPTGGHRTSAYEPYSGDALAWLGRTLPGFRFGSSQPSADVGARG